MKKLIQSIVFGAIVTSVAFLGCNEETDNDTVTETDSVTTNVDNTTRTKISKRNSGDDDKDFLADAIELNTMELRALKIGQQRGGKDVKSHASHMIKDHEALGEEVRKYISGKSIVLNDIDTNDRDDDLDDEKTGLEFDREWAEKMVDDHEDAIDLFEEAQEEVRDETLKTMIDSALPKLRSHLDMAKQLRDQLKEADKAQ
jgi:putative membrane protein